MIERKNAFTISKKEQDAYKNGVTALIKDGTYGTMVAIHANMKHDMHTMSRPGRVGTWRFLCWHRAYLLHFEKALRTKESDAFIPYWKWVDGGVPDWIKGFKPDVKVPKQGVIKNKRTNITKSYTNDARIKALLKMKDYFTFTYELELDPHNNGHVVLGLPMRRVPTAPADPMFWMHHGEVDRVWHEWQLSNSGKSLKSLKAALSGKYASKQTMDPWKDTITTLAVPVKNLGYKYV